MRPSNNKRVFEGGTKFVFSDKNTICIIYSNSNYINFCNTYLKKLKVGQIERDDGPQSHYKKQGTPTMGGIIIALRNNYRNNWRLYLLQDKRAGNSKKYSTITINNNRIWNNRLYR